MKRILSIKNILNLVLIGLVVFCGFGLIGNAVDQKYEIDEKYAAYSSDNASTSEREHIARQVDQRQMEIGLTNILYSAGIILSSVTLVFTFKRN